jgi:hypothetical protein
MRYEFKDGESALQRIRGTFWSQVIIRSDGRARTGHAAQSRSSFAIF